MQNKTPSDTSMWVQFFKEASIPAQYVQSYAHKFTENRIRFDMLPDLDRQLLNELGISAIGDCLSILKHAKTWTPTLPDTAESKPVKNTKVVSSPDAEKPVKPVVVTPSEPKQTEKLQSAISSSLSADMVSRLNFNPVKPAHERVASAETNQPAKRKLEDNEDSAKCSTRSVLEYRGISKNTPDPEEKTIIRLVNNKRILADNDGVNIKRTISMDPVGLTVVASSKTQSATANKPGGKVIKTSGPASVATIQPVAAPVRFTKKVASLQSDLMGKSVFERINKPVEESQSLKAEASKSKITITVNNTAKNGTKKQSFVPITFSENKKSNSNQQKTATKLSSVVRTVNQTNQTAKRQNRDLFSRISL